LARSLIRSVARNSRGDIGAGISVPSRTTNRAFASEGVSTISSRSPRSSIRSAVARLRWRIVCGPASIRYPSMRRVCTTPPGPSAASKTIGSTPSALER